MSLLKLINDDRNALRLVKSRTHGTDPAKINHMIAALTTLYADAAQVGFDDGRRESTDDEVIAVIKKTLKGLSISLSYKYDRLLECEYITFSGYIPTQMTSDEMSTVSSKFIAENPESKMGDVMNHFKVHHKGLYDSKTLSGIVKTQLV